MADVRLGGDEGHRHLVADLAPAQVGVHDERELVGRAEARRALHRADDDRARILDERVPRLAGGARRGRRGRPTACGPSGPRPSTSSKASFGPGGDDQVVVVERACRRRARPGSRPDARASPRADRTRCPSSRGTARPGTRCRSRLRQLTATQGLDGTKWKFGPLPTTVTRSSGAQLLLHLVGHRHAAEARTENHDVCHVRLLRRNSWPARYLSAACFIADSAATGSSATRSPALKPASTSIAPSAVFSPTRSCRNLISPAGVTTYAPATSLR